SGDAGVVRAARILIPAPTSPAAPDTDLDGVADGLERSAVGTIPVLPDLDADGVPDGVEIAPHPVTFTIDGMSSVKTVRTNPIDFDTDDDGLPDGPELFPGDGRNPSDPTDPDTDRDGLSDGAERLVHGSDPTLTDTDGDGLADSLDLSPTELWDLPWQGTFEPGMIRFTQRFDVRGVQGLSAQIWTYNLGDNACVFLSDHTADATRSSDESAANVLTTL